MRSRLRKAVLTSAPPRRSVENEPSGQRCFGYLARRRAEFPGRPYARNSRGRTSLNRTAVRREELEGHGRPPGADPRSDPKAEELLNSDGGDDAAVVAILEAGASAARQRDVGRRASSSARLASADRRAQRSTSASRVDPRSPPRRARQTSRLAREGEPADTVRRLGRSAFGRAAATSTPAAIGSTRRDATELNRAVAIDASGAHVAARHRGDVRRPRRRREPVAIDRGRDANERIGSFLRAPPGTVATSTATRNSAS